MDHLTQNDLASLRRGRLTPDQVAALGAHVRNCRDCAAFLEGLDASVRSLVTGESEWHPDDELLFAFADRKSDAADRETVETHLELCPECRTEIGELRRVVAAETPRRRAHLFALAASLAVVLAGAVWIGSRPTPERFMTKPAPRSGYARAEWQALVTRARTTREMEVSPLVAELAGRPDISRGSADAPPVALSPAGTAVESARPELTWPPVVGASYRVTIAADERIVAESEPLKTNRWRPSRDLPRGAVYQWQVEVTRAGRTSIVPPPAQPQAMFAVISETAARELQAARTAHPGDHLLLALLCARAGLVDEARRELRDHARVEPEIARALDQKLPISTNPAQ